MFRSTQTTLANTPSRTLALTAFAGGGQASATALPSDINEVSTVATIADSVKLPAAKAGCTVFVRNNAAANSMNVFPQSGENINALAANAAFAMAANANAAFVAMEDGRWATF